MHSTTEQQRAATYALTINLLFLKALVHFEKAGGVGNDRQYGTIVHLHVGVVAEGSACGEATSAHGHGKRRLKGGE